MDRAAVLAWRGHVHERFRRIAERHPPRIGLDLQDLADTASALVDGSITLSETLRDVTPMPKQVMLYRAFVRAAFRAGLTRRRGGQAEGVAPELSAVAASVGTAAARQLVFRN